MLAEFGLLTGHAGRWLGVRGFAMVARMPDDSTDPSGNTEAFRAFTNVPPEPQAASKTPLIVSGVVVAVVVLAMIVWLAG